MSIRQILDFLKDYSGIISALSALVAVVFSVYIFWRTQKLLKPMKRPLISLSEQIYNQKSGILSLIMKNVGKHPAKNLVLNIGSSPLDKPEGFKKNKCIDFPNRLDSGVLFTGSFPLNSEKNFYAYFFIKYEDWCNPKKVYYEEMWLKHRSGDFVLFHATIENKEILEPFVTKVFPERKNIK